jgi:hypothetical protein
VVLFSLPTNDSLGYSKTVVYLTDCVAISVAVPGKKSQQPTNIPMQFICEEIASLFFIAHIIEAFWEH